MTDQPQSPEPSECSKGVTTSEFWKGMIVQLVAGFVVVWSTIKGDRETAEWGMTAMVGVSVAFTASRTFLKR